MPYTVRRHMRNMRKFYFARVIGTEDNVDDYGNIIGTTVVYSNPQLCWGNISGGRGSGDTELFGIDVSYDKTISPFPHNDIPYGSVFWIETMPTIKADGSTDTPWDYVLSASSQTNNNAVIAIKRVNVSVDGNA